VSEKHRVREREREHNKEQERVFLPVFEAFATEEKLQRGPKKPAEQRQEKELRPSRQRPPLRQGEEAHSLISEKESEREEREN
jgi:hypothetical protein